MWLVPVRHFEKLEAMPALVENQCFVMLSPGNETTPTLGVTTSVPMETDVDVCTPVSTEVKVQMKQVEVLMGVLCIRLGATETMVTFKPCMTTSFCTL